MYHRHRGFTLIELAIVLVIIGLISGGILAGSNMIRNAEVQSVAEDFKRYELAINQFKDVYSALPGDFATATMQWGALGTCPTGGSTDSLATCNGNDDGIVGGAEYARIWQHLANAEMIPGSYTGANLYDVTPNQDAPASRMENAVIAAGQCDDGFISPFGDAELFFVVTQAHSSCGAASASLTPAEALSLDRKFDDEMPHTGKMRGNNQGGSITADCVDSDAVATGQYAATNTNKICVIAYRITIADGSARRF